MFENRAIYEQIGLPKTINIKEYTYVFKKELKMILFLIDVFTLNAHL